MRSVLFEERVDVTPVTVSGSRATIDRGIGFTAASPGRCNPGWFVGESTLILGAGDAADGAVARWELLVDPGLIERCEAGFLVICCERTHGGLHSRRDGALARVTFNGHNRDLIGLKDKPDGHTDFFHRLPDPPKLPRVWPIAACATVYSWPVESRHFANSETQVVAVELEKDIAWDIDYVSLLILRRTVQLREACKQIGYVLLGSVLGAVLGAIATLLLVNK